MTERPHSNECDVLVVGAGPAGLAATHRIAATSGRRVLLIEKGSSLQQRICPALSVGKCPGCRRCGLLQGVGGASGMLGGKLCFFPAGQRLSEHTGQSTAQANRRVFSYFDSIGFHTATNNLAWASDGATGSIGLRSQLKVYDAIPLLRPSLIELFQRLLASISLPNVTLQSETELSAVSDGDASHKFAVCLTGKNGTQQFVRVRESIVFATGRSTSNWLLDIASKLGVRLNETTVDVGVRIEVPQASLADVLCEYEDPKIVQDVGLPSEVRSLCWCRGGEMSVTHMHGRSLVDGHFGERWKGMTSVSIVSRLGVPPDTSPCDHALAQFVRRLPTKPLQQSLAGFVGSSDRLSDRAPMRPYECADVDFRSIMESAVYEKSLQFIETLNALGGGRLLQSGGSDGRVYGPVIDNQWGSPALDRSLMTNVDGVYIAGDITGLGRGIVQAIYSGLHVGDAIVKQPTTSRIQSEANSLES